MLDDSKAVYWKYGHGFKAGHFNSINITDEPARPETIDAVEAGFRGIWFDGLLSMDGAIFYYKYKDYQVFLFDDQANSPPSLVIKNAKSTEQYGVELNIFAEPLRDVLPEDWWGPEVTGRFSWLRSRFIDFTNRRTIATPTSGIVVEIVDYSGNSLPNSPSFKVSGTVEWPMDFGSYGSVIPRYDFAWTDDLFFDPSNGVGVSRAGPLPDLALGQPAYILHSLRLTYRNPESTVEIAFWVRNIADRRYRSYAFDASTFSKLILNFVGEPRSMGVDLALRF
jgi:iron complex outermembrane receptor protein